MALYQHRYLGHTAGGENWLFSWWADSVRALGDAHTEALAWANTLWDGAVAGSGVEDHMNTGVGLDQVTTVQVTAATGVQVSRTDTALPRAGLSASNPLPADVALVVSLRTATPTRAGRGRFYLPQFVVADVTADGRVAADLLADLAASLAAAWSGYNTASDRPVVYSRTQRLTRNVVSFDIGDLFDTQRGREQNLVESRSSTAMP